MGHGSGRKANQSYSVSRVIQELRVLGGHVDDNDIYNTILPGLSGFE